MHNFLCWAWVLISALFLISFTKIGLTVTKYNKIVPSSYLFEKQENLYHIIYNVNKLCQAKKEREFLCFINTFIPINLFNTHEQIHYQLKMINDKKKGKYLIASWQVKEAKQNLMQANINIVNTNLDALESLLLSQKNQPIAAIKHNAFNIFKQAYITEFKFKIKLPIRISLAQINTILPNLNIDPSLAIKTFYPATLQIDGNFDQQKSNTFFLNANIKIIDGANFTAKFQGNIDGKLWVFPILSAMESITENKKVTFKNYVHPESLLLSLQNTNWVQKIVTTSIGLNSALQTNIGIKSLGLYIANKSRQYRNYRIKRFYQALSDFISDPERLEINITGGHSAQDGSKIWGYLLGLLKSEYHLIKQKNILTKTHSTKDQKYYEKQLQEKQELKSKITSFLKRYFYIVYYVNGSNTAQY